MNVDGRCGKRFCPLANSKYATVVERRGRVYLCIKTPERVHTPRDWWEKILLPADKEGAWAVIESHLQWWDQKAIFRCKKRWTVLHKMLRRMRRMRKHPQARLVTYKKKAERRLRSREERALGVARIEGKIEQELLSRFKSGLYGDLYAKLKEQQDQAMREEEEDEQEMSDDEEELYEFDEEDEISDAELDALLESEGLDIEDILDEYERKFDDLSSDDSDDLSDDDDDDDDDIAAKAKKMMKKKKGKKPKKSRDSDRYNYEMEEEREREETSRLIE